MSNPSDIQSAKHGFQRLYFPKLLYSEGSMFQMFIGLTVADSDHLRQRRLCIWSCWFVCQQDYFWGHFGDGPDYDPHPYQADCLDSTIISIMVGKYR